MEGKVVQGVTVPCSAPPPPAWPGTSCPLSTETSQLQVWEHSGSGRDTRIHTARCPGLDLKELPADGGGGGGTALTPSLLAPDFSHCTGCCGVRVGAGNLSSLKRASVDVLALVPSPQYLLYIVVQSISPFSFATPSTVVHQAPPSMGFTRQEYQSGLPFPSPEGLPDPGIETVASALAGRFFTNWVTGNTHVF